MEKNQLIYVIEVARLGSITRRRERCTCRSRPCPTRLSTWRRSWGFTCSRRVRKRVYLTEAAGVCGRGEKDCGQF